MRKHEGDSNLRWLRSAGAQRQAIIKRAEDIHTLKSRGRAFEALQAEHEAIEMVLRCLAEAVLSGVSRAEVIEILNASIDFCATHFADEEGFMRESGDSHVDAHAVAHKQLLARLVAVRRSASGEGLALATLDAVGLLRAFHEHVKTWDRSGAAARRAKWRPMAP